MEKSLKYQIQLGSESIIDGQTVKFEHLLTDDDGNPMAPEDYQVGPLSVDALGDGGFVRRPGEDNDIAYMFLDYPNGVTGGDGNLLYDCTFVGGRPNVIRRPS